MNNTEIEKEVKEDFDKFIVSRGSSDSMYVQLNYDKLLEFINLKLQERDEKWGRAVEGLKRNTRDLALGYETDLTFLQDNSYDRALRDVINLLK